MGVHVDVASIGISDSVGLVESGDIRVLAITAEKRVGSGLVAEMPTCVEQGIDMTFVNWTCRSTPCASGRIFWRI